MSATDWLKMRSDIARDPKICRMVEYLTGSVDGDALRDALRDAPPSVTEALRVTPCHILRHAIIGSLVTIWGTLRHRGDRRGDDLVVNEAGCRTVDAVGEFDGIGYAMSRVGWLIVEGTSVVLPRFFVHFNDDPSQHKRKLANDRQRRYRESKKGGACVTSPLRNGLRNEVTENRNENENENINPSVSPQGESASQSDAKQKTPRKRNPRQPLPATLAEPFNVWWKTYPRRTKPGDASRAYLSAINRLVAVGQSEEQAIATLQEAAAAFAPFGKTQGVYCPYPASWLNGEQYHDDRATWNPDSTGQPRASDLPRQRSFESIKIITNQVGPNATEAATNRLLDLEGG